jgi:hypothetical protein
MEPLSAAGTQLRLGTGMCAKDDTSFTSTLYGKAEAGQWDYYRGKVVVVNRGGCTFEEKARAAQQAGAAALVVLNNVGTKPFLMAGLTEQHLAMPWALRALREQHAEGSAKEPLGTPPKGASSERSSETAVLHIPVLMLSQEDGAWLKKQMGNSNTSNISNTSCAIRITSHGRTVATTSTPTDTRTSAEADYGLELPVQVEAQLGWEVRLVQHANGTHHAHVLMKAVVDGVGVASAACAAGVGGCAHGSNARANGVMREATRLVVHHGAWREEVVKDVHEAVQKANIGRVLQLLRETMELTEEEQAKLLSLVEEDKEDKDPTDPTGSDGERERRRAPLFSGGKARRHSPISRRAHKLLKAMDPAMYSSRLKVRYQESPVLSHIASTKSHRQY